MYGSVPFKSERDFWIRQFTDSNKNQVCASGLRFACSTDSPSSNGILNRGVGGGVESNSTRDIVVNRVTSISETIRSSLLIPPCSSSVPSESTRRRKCRKGTREKGEQTENRREHSERHSLPPYFVAFLMAFSLGAGEPLEPSEVLRTADERASFISLLARAFGTPRTSAERSGVAKGLVMR
jgi:hypothetical protein